MTMSGTVTTTPAWTLPTSTLMTLSTSTVMTVPTSETNITGIYVGVGALGIGGLILLVFIVTRFKHHWCPKSNTSYPIELKKYQNAVGEAHVEVDDKNGNSFYNPDYKPTADDPLESHDIVPNPVYISSATERPIPTENTCGASNVQADIPRVEHKPTSVLPMQVSGKVEEAKATVHVLPIYSDVQKNIPGIPPQSSDLLTNLASQDTVTPSASTMESPVNKMLNHELMQIGNGNENSLHQRSDLLLSPSETQPINTAHTTSSYEDYPVQPTPPPHGEIIYVIPQVFTSGDNKKLMEDLFINDHVYAVPKVVSKSYQQSLEVTNDNITEIRELGNGHFGKVMLAATQELSLKDMQLSKTDDNRDASILVAVKKLIDHPSKTQRESFIKEAKFMSSLNHQNVVKLIGVCYDEPAFMMMEYMEEGDLNEFLQRYSEIVETPSNDTQISTSTVVYMAFQIASAMKYLASLNFIHRDIASRNCLVGKNFSVKLADFGMSRNLYESHYYQMQGKTALPIRWMSTECFYGLFTEKSDVWAFGVTMWELFILAKEAPYSDLSDEEMIIDATKLKGAHRQLLPRPSVCPIPVYNIMRRCWAIDPKGRTNFEEIEEMLQTYMVS